jgi:hypothetical protein
VWGLGASTHLAFPWAASALVAQVNTLAPFLEGIGML